MIDIKIIKKENDSLLEKLSDPKIISDWEKFQELKKRKDFLERIINISEDVKNIETRIKENESIISGREDEDLFILAEGEMPQLLEKKKQLEKNLKDLLLNRNKKEIDSDKQDTNKNINAVIVEIRAGAGGDEAGLFAGDLYKMYSKYAEKQDWKIKVLDSNNTEIGGVKEIIFEISGKDVFSKMKNEAGVHRVQRIPTTEKSGRIHTSTASVAVLAKPEKAEIKIKPDELKIDTFKSSGPGGQYVNKRMTAVRVTHLPTNTVVASQNERSLQQNKENALSILEARLLEKQEQEQDQEVAGKRKDQVGTADRSEKIRTYNFPQDRITDHRIKKSFHNLEEVMQGRLDSIFKAFEKSK